MVTIHTSQLLHGAIKNKTHRARILWLVHKIRTLEAGKKQAIMAMVLPRSLRKGDAQVDFHKLLNLPETLKELSLARPVFHSEADFQFALASHLRKKFSGLEIRLEIPMTDGMILDLLLAAPFVSEKYAIELKYKTTAWEGNINGEQFKLKSHGADDIGCYDTLKDVERIEYFISSGLATQGAVILLTNDPVYWRPRPPGAKITNAHQFRIHEDLVISGERSWGPATGGANRGRESAIPIFGEYSTKWEDYSQIGGEKGSFRGAIFQIL